MLLENVLHMHLNLETWKWNGPIDPICTHSTPHTNSNITQRHLLDWLGSWCRPVPLLRVHVYAIETKFHR